MTDIALDAPTKTVELRSTVSSAGTVTVALCEAAVAPPAAHEVTVRIEAAPINPSDLGPMLARADLSTARALAGDSIGLLADLSPEVTHSHIARHDRAIVCGGEGGGVVIASGSSPEAQSLLGQTVGFASGNSYAQYRTIPVAHCFPMPDGTTPEEGAAPFVNPLTALGMVETMHEGGHRAIVHTVGASNLGLMLNRLCQADGIPLINIVRRAEQAELLRGTGAEYVLDSTSDTFEPDLVDLLATTGATIGFDPIGGGEMTSLVLAAMEQAANRTDGRDPYNAPAHKQMFVYGGLDRSPTVLSRDFGTSWSVGSWRLRPFLARIGANRAEPLRRRVASEITTTFASSYGLRLTLPEVVDPDQARIYAQMTTGRKALITPHR